VPAENDVDLGVTIDNQLKFSDHINRIVCKAHKRANLIIRCFVCKDIQTTPLHVKDLNLSPQPIMARSCSVMSLVR